MSSVSTVQRAAVPSAAQESWSSRWEMIAETVTALALQFILPIGVVFVASLILPASIIAVALPIAALCSAAAAPFLFLQVASPLPLDAPRGMRREGNNCWVNSLFQLLHCDAEIKRWLLSRSCPRQLRPFAEYIRAYDAAIERGMTVVPADSGALRAALAQLNPALGADSSSQQDLTEGWLAFASLLPERYRVNLQEKYHYAPLLEVGQPPILPADANRPWNAVDFNGMLQLAIVGNHPTFETLMRDHFDTHINDLGARLRLRGVDGKVHNYPAIRSERRFEQAPPALWVQFKRFGSSGKIHTEVEIPDRYEIRPMHGDVAHYQLDGFAVHLGETKNSGHYIAFRKIGGRWYKIDDHKVTIVEGNDLAQYRRQAYFVHYSK